MNYINTINDGNNIDKNNSDKNITSSILDNYILLKQKVEQIATYSTDTTTPIKIIAISKKISTDAIEFLYNAGQLAFGENYFNEFKYKTTKLKHLDIEWHFIGTLQSNKLKHLVGNADWVHSLEKPHHAIKLNQLLDKYAHSQNNMNNSNSNSSIINNKIAPLNVLIEVNISHEINKHGVKNFTEIVELANLITQQPYLNFRGLMGMASNTQDINIQINQFNELTNIFNSLKQHGFPNIDTISMGMSNDYVSAIKCGATMVRIGSKIFGERL